jgi:Ulp1 family protease
MRGRGDKYMEGLFKWVKAEGLTKNVVIDECERKFFNRSDNPKQDNSFDCGVFTIVCADFLLDNLPLNYSQENMEFWRQKIAIDILRGRLRY